VPRGDELRLNLEVVTEVGQQLVVHRRMDIGSHHLVELRARSRGETKNLGSSRVQCDVKAVNIVEVLEKASL
jgi:hypothetical protein